MKAAFCILSLLWGIAAFAQNKFQLSVHVLDISKGLPVAQIAVILEKYQPQSKEWHFVDKKITPENGRIPDFLPYHSEEHKGIYRLHFALGTYFTTHYKDSFYPFVEVVFQIQDAKHHHIPLAFSPYGYNTKGISPNK